MKNIDDADPVVQALAVVAVLAWLVAAATFMWAVVTPLPDRPSAPEGENLAQVKLEFVTKALDYRKDLEDVQKRQRKALLATIVAMLITTAAFAAGIVIAKPVDTLNATVLVTEDGQKTVNALSDKSAPKLFSGTVKADSLKKNDVVITVPGAKCPLATQLHPKDDQVRRRRAA